jgi:hypothetical protein
MAGAVAGDVDLSRFEGMSDEQAQKYLFDLASTNPVEYERVKDELLATKWRRRLSGIHRYRTE